MARWEAREEDGSEVDPTKLPAANVLRTGQPETGRIVQFLSDNFDEPRWFSINSFPLAHAGEAVPYAAVSSFSEITDRKRLADELQHLALYDELTGLTRRTLFSDRLDGALAASSAEPDADKGVGLVVLDLDGFKEINDVHGHAVGDEVLRLVAQRLQESTRKVDTIARFGGDEFVVLFTDTTEAELAETGRRIVEAIRQPMAIVGPGEPEPSRGDPLGRCLLRLHHRQPRRPAGRPPLEGRPSHVRDEGREAPGATPGLTPATPGAPVPGGARHPPTLSPTSGREGARGCDTDGG